MIKAIDWSEKSKTVTMLTQVYMYVNACFHIVFWYKPYLLALRYIIFVALLVVCWGALWCVFIITLCVSLSIKWWGVQGILLLDVWKSLSKQKIGSCSQGVEIIMETNEHTVRNMNYSYLVTYLHSLKAVSAVRLTDNCWVWESKLQVYPGIATPSSPLLGLCAVLLFIYCNLEI